MVSPSSGSLPSKLSILKEKKADVDPGHTESVMCLPHFSNIYFLTLGIGPCSVLEQWVSTYEHR